MKMQLLAAYWLLIVMLFGSMSMYADSTLINQIALIQGNLNKKLADYRVLENKLDQMPSPTNAQELKEQGNMAKKLQSLSDEIVKGYQSLIDSTEQARVEYQDVAAQKAEMEQLFSATPMTKKQKTIKADIDARYNDASQVYAMVKNINENIQTDPVKQAWYHAALSKLPLTESAPAMKPSIEIQSQPLKPPKLPVSFDPSAKPETAQRSYYDLLGVSQESAARNPTVFKEDLVKRWNEIAEAYAVKYPKGSVQNVTEQQEFNAQRKAFSTLLSDKKRAEYDVRLAQEITIKPPSIEAIKQPIGILPAEPTALVGPTVHGRRPRPTGGYFDPGTIRRPQGGIFETSPIQQLNKPLPQVPEAVRLPY